MSTWNEIPVPQKAAYVGGMAACLLAGPVAYLAAEGNVYCFAQPKPTGYNTDGTPIWNRFPRWMLVIALWFLTPALGALYAFRLFLTGRNLNLLMWSASYALGAMHILFGFAGMISMCQVPAYGTPGAMDTGGNWVAVIFQLFGGVAMAFAGLTAQRWDHPKDPFEVETDDEDGYGAYPRATQ